MKRPTTDTTTIQRAELETALSRISCESLSLGEIAVLLSHSADEHLETLAHAANELTRKIFGRTVKLYAPIYISNECINGCLYCGFNASSKIARRTLSIDEVKKEAETLISTGHRHLLLVSGEDPKAVTVDSLCEIAKSIRPSCASLSVEVQPFDESGYRKLSEAGVDGVTLYQETYDRISYEKFHRSGPKKFFEARLRSVDSAGAAGMRFLGLGALLGLFDWRQEALSLIAHAREMMKKHWRSFVTVSVPRIRDCSSSFKMPNPVTDRDLAHMICVLRLALPRCGIILSTREPADLRRNLLPLGVTQMSAGSCTSPGGYTSQEKSGEQFHMEDHRKASEVATSLIEMGYDPIWKDWDSNLFGTNG
ncbi:MAG TPA: 2-iminoacetate synthase ThiH [bacterium]|nr:2-iminoacetate synthase ThiH [Myxococcales bacterium]HPW45029.1 2-iminoacetate synthase ThiH [bacterium]